MPVSSAYYPSQPSQARSCSFAVFQLKWVQSGYTFRGSSIAADTRYTEVVHGNPCSQPAGRPTQRPWPALFVPARPCACLSAAIKNDRYEIECVRPGVHFRFRAFSVAAMARVSAAQRCKHRAERPPRSAHEALHGGSESYPFLQRDPSCCACPVRPNLVALLVRGRRHHQTSPRRVRGGRADLCRSRPGSGFELREG